MNNLIIPVNCFCIRSIMIGACEDNTVKPIMETSSRG